MSLGRPLQWRGYHRYYDEYVRRYPWKRSWHKSPGRRGWKRFDKTRVHRLRRQQERLDPENAPVRVRYLSYP